MDYTTSQAVNSCRIRSIGSRQTRCRAPYDAAADCPRWIAFLDDVLEGDRERIEALQDWFGLNLTTDTRYQKFFLLVGPPRAGKGTVLKVLNGLVGAHNVASPTLSSLGDSFGLAALLGRSVAILGDAHLGTRADKTLVLETLKNIIGEDTITINRKYQQPLNNIRLNCRFTIATNEMPRLGEASGTLSKRMVIVPFNRSYSGREDTGLEARLVAELPGITNWAMEGLRRLRERGGFVEPSIAESYKTTYDRLASPLSAFIEDRCEVEQGSSVATTALFSAWRRWCEENGHEAGADATFGKNLLSYNPNIRRIRPMVNGDRAYHYAHIDLRDEAPTY